MDGRMDRRKKRLIEVDAPPKKSNPDCKLVYNENQFIKKEGQMEFWWNVSITNACQGQAQ